MSKLSYQQRKELPKSKFALPNERRFPIPDMAHARNALSRLPQAHGLSSEDKKRIMSKAAAKLGHKTESMKKWFDFYLLFIDNLFSG